MKNLFLLLSTFFVFVGSTQGLYAQSPTIYQVDCDVATDKSNLVFGYVTINGEAPNIATDSIIFFDDDGLILVIAGFQEIANPSCPGQVGFFTNVSGETDNPAIACVPEFGYKDGELIQAFIYDESDNAYYIYPSSMTYNDTPGATADGASSDCNDVPDVGALPIRLTAFSGVAIDHKTSLLQWSTAREENASHFEVQYSIDGLDWTVLSKVDAIGESEENQFYDLTHQGELSPVNFYRLKMIDNDDSYEFSGIIIIELSVEGDREVNIFPNPIAKDANLSIQLRGDWSADQDITADLYDAQGRLLMKRSGLAGGTSSLALPDGLYGGMYLLRIQQGQHSDDQRILIK